MDSVSKPLAQFIVKTKWEDLQTITIKNMKMVLLDSIGCAIAGIATDPGKMAASLAKQLGGPQESTIFGLPGKVSCVNAALANGQLINAIDYDAMGPGAHTPPYIIPPAFAMAERNQASGKDLIIALALGFEIGARISEALSKGSKFTEPDKTSLEWLDRWGQEANNFGAAAGAAKILNLDQDQVLNCLGIAGHLCQVPTWVRYSLANNRSMAKYGVPGWQNTGGVMAALLAEMGYLGDISVLDDKEGFWKFVGYSEWYPDSVLKDLGTNWISNAFRYKAFPCCSMFHVELSCFLDLVEKHHLKAEEIESVALLGHPTLDAPCFTNPAVKQIADIQFGPATIFAMAINGVPKGADWQDLNLANSLRIVNFAKKVKYQGSTEFGSTQMSKVEIAARGQTFKGQLSRAEMHKLSDDEIIEKFKSNSSRLLTDKKIAGAIDLILNLEKLKDLSEVVKNITL